MWSNLLSAIVGGALATAGAIITQSLQYQRENKHRRQALAGSFAGEIAAICGIARRRNYLGHAQELLEYVRHSGQPKRLVLRVTQNYLQIYDSNANTLGLLPPDSAEKIVLFYTQIKSLLEDVVPDAPNPPDKAAAEEWLQAEIHLLEDTLRLGDQLVAQLREVRS